MVSPTDTVSLGQGSAAGRAHDRSAGLRRVYEDALAAGLGEEGARAAVAVAATEGGMGGAVGDLAGGGSYGTFQLYAQGQLPNYARATGVSVEQAKARLRQDPHAANRWALAGYLGGAIRTGMAQGLRGPALATHAQRTGQVSVSPERAGQQYAAVWGAGGPKVQAQVTGGGAVASKTAERIASQIKEKRRQLEVARGRIEGLSSGAAPEQETEYDSGGNRVPTANAKAIREQREGRLKQVQAEVRDLESDIERLEKEAAAEADKEAAKPKPTAPEDLVPVNDPTTGRPIKLRDPATGQVIDLPDPRQAAGPRATRSYKQGGVTYTETAPDAGGFQPLPAGLDDPDAMTPYQSAQLPIQQQNADSSRLAAQASWLQAQISQGRLSYDRAKQVFDYIVAQQAPVEEGGKLYEPGLSPGNKARQFYGVDPQPYSVVDAAGFFGRPELNQHVRGPYPYGQGPMSPEEYRARQAGTFQGAQPGVSSPSSPAGGPVPDGGPEPAAGGFMPQPQEPPPPDVPTVPEFGNVGALAQRRQALMADLEKTRRLLMAKGVDPQVADRAARAKLGVGAPALTPY